MKVHEIKASVRHNKAIVAISLGLLVLSLLYATYAYAQGPATPPKELFTSSPPWLVVFVTVGYMATSFFSSMRARRQKDQEAIEKELEVLKVRLEQVTAERDNLKAQLAAAQLEDRIAEEVRRALEGRAGASGEWKP